ncbi:hypothetical protein EMPS_00521 [Entomortierella parvispora]|uniref:Uncharacterized protein n=1 Tax=Entomortierella parvispora TaxID=205924 RepID=A0A9P3H134_9FUNG|nr:hypothetical protein EMPS_00521 [Entomortierella parvispora]
MARLTRFLALVFTLVVSLQVVIAQTLYQIQNIRAGSRPIGVDPFRIPSLPVHAGGPLNRWTFEQTGTNRYLLHIQDAPPKVGVGHNDVVTASLFEEREWEIVRGRQEHTFHIRLATTQIFPGRYWTAGNGPNDPVTIQVAEIPTESQTWSLNSADN